MCIDLQHGRACSPYFASYPPQIQMNAFLECKQESLLSQDLCYGNNLTEPGRQCRDGVGINLDRIIHTLFVPSNELDTLIVSSSLSMTHFLCSLPAFLIDLLSLHNLFEDLVGFHTLFEALFPFFFSFYPSRLLLCLTMLLNSCLIYFSHLQLDAVLSSVKGFSTAALFTFHSVKGFSQRILSMRIFSSFR
jgi:hypothetical protein